MLIVRHRTPHSLALLKLEVLDSTLYREWLAHLENFFLALHNLLTRLLFKKLLKICFLFSL
jgi:hypothetical protein